MIYRIGLLLALALCVSAFPGRASTIIDQFLTSGNDEGANINECCAFLAQTYTAGLSGTLAGVSVDIREFAGDNYPLDVQIRTVSDGLPTTTILGETTTSVFSLADMIVFSQVIPQAPGVQYAIVVDFLGAPPQGSGQGVGAWRGGTGNLYPGGLATASEELGNTWPIAYSDIDSNFITYVNTTPEPTALLLLGSGLLAILIVRRATMRTGEKREVI